MTPTTLPIERQPAPLLMWRAYTVALNIDNKLVLAGATNRKWAEVEYAATCYVGVGGAANQLRDRVHNSRVFLPGQLEATKRTDDISIARQRCKLHLETGQCTCGVWGYKAPARVQREYLNSAFWKPNGSFPYVEVLCAVRIYGTILEGIYGYRVSNAEIEAMFVPGNIAMYLPISDSMRPAFDTDARMAWLTSQPYSQSKRLDPKAVWQKLIKTYSCNVIPIADGVTHIELLDRDYPDVDFRPLSRMPILPVLDFGEPDESV